uniref:Uncharacterized protein n=1 Tax=Anguilla anguilla TaxID=7936 RepID=A0A0E9W2N6_ANGAN
MIHCSSIPTLIILSASSVNPRTQRMKEKIQQMFLGKMNPQVLPESMYHLGLHQCIMRET